MVVTGPDVVVVLGGDGELLVVVVVVAGLCEDVDPSGWGRSPQSTWSG